MHAQQIRIIESPSVRDAFASELFRLSPPQLRALSLRGSANLRSLVLSPLGSCPALESVDLGSCPSLEYVMVQSATLKTLDLSDCGALTKVTQQASREYGRSVRGRCCDGCIVAPSTGRGPECQLT